MAMLLLDKEFDAAAIPDAEELDIRNIGERDWEIVLRARRVARLSLYHITSLALPNLGTLTSVRSLSMNWATKVANIEPVFRMTGLTSLAISDFPKLQCIDGIGQLSGLNELHLSGNLGSLSPPLSLESIGPAADLPFLEVFSLRNARLADDDIAILSRCRRLRRLELSNQFEKRQFAYLAKCLNHQLDEPIRAHHDTGMGCGTCGRNMQRVTGRRGGFLCGACDSKRLQKAEAEFAALVDTA